MNDVTWYYLRESYFPQFLAIQIVGCGVHVGFVEKAYVDAFAVAAGSAGRTTVEPVHSLERTLQDVCSPDFAAFLPVDTEQFSRFVFFIGCNEEKLFSDHDWGSMSLALYR